MNPFLDIIRPSVCLLSAFGVIVGALIAGVFDYRLILFGSATAFLISAAGNVDNDFVDYKIDKINKPKKPIPSGKIKLPTARYFALGLFAMAAICMIFTNSWFQILAIFNIFFILIYSRFLKKMVIGHFADSWLPVSTFLAGSFLSMSISPTVLILCFMAYFGNLGREIVKGVEDMKGDIRVGAKTMAVVFGRNFSYVLAIAFVAMAVLTSPFPYTLGIFSINYLYAVLIADALFGISLLFLPVPSKSQKIMKIAMYFGILAFLVGAFL